ncbi:MAG: cytochrome c3 family protein [Thermodesulfobacteriota bacterium]
MIPRKRALGALVVSAAGILLAGAALSASEAPKKEILISNPEVFKERKFGPAKFDHTKHGQLLCVQCHHVYEDEENVWKPGDEVNKCASCHKLETSETTPSLERAMHGQCFSCHKRAKKAGLKTGPTVCVLCHPKQKDTTRKQ